MEGFFSNNIDHIMAELGRIELKLQYCLTVMRNQNEDTSTDRFQGLYISEKEMDAISGIAVNQDKKEESSLYTPEAIDLAKSLSHLEKDISEKKEESIRRGIELRLVSLEQMFRLSSFDIDTLLACLLTEINLKYQRVYAYLQDDVTQKSPTVDLVLKLLCKTFPEMLKHRQAFSADAPLIKYQLVRLCEDHTSKPTPLLDKSLQMDERIIHYLLGIDQLDPCLSRFTQLVQPELDFEELILPGETRQFINTLVARGKKAPVCYLHGDNGVGKKATAEAICKKLGLPVLYVELNRMLSGKENTETSLHLIVREGMLWNAALYLNGYDVLFPVEEGSKFDGDDLVTEVMNYPKWIFIAGNKEWNPKVAWQNRPFVSIELPMPSYSLRKELWEKYWDKNIAMEDDVDFSDLAGKFKLTGEQIRNVTINARNLVRLREPGHQTVNGKDISSICRTESREVLHNMARKIKPKYGWEDIILPVDLFEQLKEIYGCVQHYHRVYSDWGFDKKLSLGKGLHVLFSGPSGTGKTMAAEILAHELMLDLYKIDLSNVVSKYIGETEKNLDRIFREGQTSNSILFFDEADAIFGKRSEVKDAHDRYANIEISYLLQKMDEYEGMVILATNLRKNIDEAFSRRIHFALEFPVPDEPDRNRIWHSIFPPETPLDSNIDFTFMARQFRITGGNIKNIALGAAFLAAQNGNIINMNNIIRATKREYQKIGKLCTEDEFAQYINLVK
ncbi:MAG TPA: ATP-binding protein [Dehalococcoidia bacterium]|nr:ATP-binding protein [Dehalococcoidia bacterium]